MRKTLSFVLVAVLILTTLLLSGCSNSKAVVESVFEIDSNYAGHREIKIKYPLDAQIDSLTQQLLENNPLKESKVSKFEYLGVEQDGYVFVMDIAFESYSDYISQMSELVGREVTSSLSQPQSVLCSGTRMKEDFDVADIINWVIQISGNNEETRSIEYDYAVNTVSINGTVFSTTSTIDISQREGKAINSILVETTNLKDGTFDRTVTFVVPDKTYTDLAGSIEPYFASITHPQAQYSGWTNQGTNWEYKVIFKSLSIDELSQFTQKLLDTPNEELFYGDKDNSSTPLSEGLVFEENFDTFSFINSDGESIKLEYRYALPTKTTHGEGTVFTDGKWNTVGVWQDSVYTTSFETDTMKIRIPDGIQYSINGINMYLEVVDKDRFVRTTDFLYSKTQGMDGMLYAKDFFARKGAQVLTDEDDENLICRVVCEGSSSDITTALVKYFGSGNFIAFEAKDAPLSLSVKTKMTEYINLATMLNSTNANRPITYTVKSSYSENINELSGSGTEPAKKTKDSKTLTVDVAGGLGTVIYNGNIPNTGNIILYCVIGVVMLSLTVAAIVYMLAKQRKKQSLGASDNFTNAPQQTTTFSIAELGVFSDQSSKALRNQIDKEIEEKIEADRIENLSKELKAKEIAQYEKMIYGNKDETEETNSESDTQVDLDSQSESEE